MMRGKRKVCQNLSAAALLNMYLSPLYNPNLFTLALIKVDCWLNENRLYFFFQIESSDSIEDKSQAYLLIFLDPHSLF